MAGLGVATAMETASDLPDAGPGLHSVALAAAPRTRVLVVDDDKRNLLALGEVLEDIAEVVRASSGEEALRCLLKDEFAVILLDVLMPGLDGYETAGLVRAREQSRNTPIIFLTAINKEDAHLLKGYDSGAVDFVFKPFEPTILRSKVAVFVKLFEKTQEVELRAAREQKLLEENLRAHTDRLEAEQALQRVQHRQDAILQSLPVCFHARSALPPFGAHFVSRTVERLTGFAPERLTEDPHFGLSRVHPDDRSRLIEALSGARESGVYSCEFRWLCADGTYRIFFDQGLLAAEGDGPPEIFGTMLDITERRQLENQLLQAQKLDAVGKLTGGIAHDFNNLLASVLSGLSLIERRTVLDQRTKDVVEMTRHAAEQGSQLVNRMLTFSRRQNLKPEVVDLAQTSHTLHQMLAPVLGGLIRLDWVLDPAAWPAFVDPSQLELAIMNLVLNARDAMPSGGTITIRIANQRMNTRTNEIEPGDFVVITVEDTGSGIGPEVLPKVLEPFFTTKDVGKGTGLGLSTAYGFARQSGGTLHIESALGRGTAVEIWLPRSASGAGEVVPGGDPQEPVGSTKRAPLNILLVDDSPTLRKLTEMSLIEEGHAVSSASGGAEALALIEREPARFDLIVTDYAMPLISGLEVIRFARNLRADWPAVMVTGYANADDIAERPDDVPLVIKPFSRKALLDAIGRASQGAEPAGKDGAAVAAL